MNPNSAFYWWPRLEPLGNVCPRTELVECPFENMIKVIDGDLSGIPLQDIERACNKVGYPIFLRTDLASAKHQGPEAYLVNNANDLPRVIALTIEDNVCKSLNPEGFMIRRFIPMKHLFCAFRSHPISREFRFFVKGESNLCHHFYWPIKALSFYGKKPEGWEEKYSEISRPLDPEDLQNLSAIARKAGSLLTIHESWSVDFALDTQDKWWLIDVAEAELSWHPEDCKGYISPHIHMDDGGEE